MASGSEPKPVVTGYSAGGAPTPPQQTAGASASSAYPATNPYPAANAYPTPYSAANAYPAANGYPYAANGYPYAANPYYAAPPPAHPYYNPGYQGQVRPSGTSLFLRRLIIAFIAVVVIIGLVSFITWLVLRPTLPSVSVSSASVSGLNATSPQQLSASFDIGYTFENSNKKLVIDYEDVQTAVYYHENSIADTALPPFSQDKGNSIVIAAKLAAASEYIKGDSVSQIQNEKVKGELKLNLRIAAWVRFRSGIWRSRMRVMRVYCDNVRFGFPNASSGGSLVGGATKCEVYI